MLLAAALADDWEGRSESLMLGVEPLETEPLVGSMGRTVAWGPRTRAAEEEEGNAKVEEEEEEV